MFPATSNDWQFINPESKPREAKKKPLGVFYIIIAIEIISILLIVLIAINN